MVNFATVARTVNPVIGVRHCINYSMASALRNARLVIIKKEVNVSHALYPIVCIAVNRTFVGSASRIIISLKDNVMTGARWAPLRWRLDHI